MIGQERTNILVKATEPLSELTALFEMSEEHNHETHEIIEV